MPVLTLDHLIHSQALRDVVARLADSAPGLVLTTGGAGSGKLTTLLALALRLAGPGQEVLFVTDDPQNIVPFAPLPDHWREVLVEPNAQGWRNALRSGMPVGAIIVVAPLDAVNAEAVLSAAAGRWLLATVDTPAIGLDVAAVVHRLGVRNEAFIDSIRLVWSQQLAGALCSACSVPAQLSAAESADLFPDGMLVDRVRTEVGCPACQAAANANRGTRGSTAICDATLIDDQSRSAVRAAMLAGVPLPTAPAWHVAAQDEVRALVAQGIIGVGTYRNVIARNPSLRARHA
jgi:type II secretory ATPase GspE/PulE/Tfp pilus assembly ATPase PilB-like protein